MVVPNHSGRGMLPMPVGPFVTAVHVWATTNVTTASAIVTIARWWPRARKVGSATRKPRKPAMPAATKMAIHTGTPARVVRRAEAYAPKANSAPCPSET